MTIKIGDRLRRYSRIFDFSNDALQKEARTAMLADADAVDALESRLAAEIACSTCDGVPHASGLPCVCGGTNRRREEVAGLRLAINTLELRLTEKQRRSSRDHDAFLRHISETHVSNADPISRRCCFEAGRSSAPVAAASISEVLRQFCGYLTAMDHGPKGLRLGAHFVVPSRELMAAVDAFLAASPELLAARPPADVERLAEEIDYLYLAAGRANPEAINADFRARLIDLLRAHLSAAPVAQETLPDGCSGVDWCERHGIDHGHPEPPPDTAAQQEEIMHSDVIQQAVVRACNATVRYDLYREGDGVGREFCGKSLPCPEHDVAENAVPLCAPHNCKHGRNPCTNPRYEGSRWLCALCSDCTVDVRFEAKVPDVVGAGELGPVDTAGVAQTDRASGTDCIGTMKFHEGSCAPMLCEIPLSDAWPCCKPLPCPNHPAEDVRPLASRLAAAADLIQNPNSAQQSFRTAMHEIANGAGESADDLLRQLRDICDVGTNDDLLFEVRRLNNARETDEPLASQIDRLAHFIMDEIPGEPSQSEGAVDCAIRIMREMQTKLAVVQQHYEQLEAMNFDLTHERDALRDRETDDAAWMERAERAASLAAERLKDDARTLPWTRLGCEELRRIIAAAIRDTRKEA